MKLKHDATDYTLRGTSEVLTERYPHLTAAEHADRRQTALHEASHLITAMVLRTGWVGCRAFVRVPRKPSGMDRTRGVSGSVQCGADGWERAIVCFAGIAAAFITNDPHKIVAGRHDAADGMTTVHEFVGTDDEQIIYEVRWELLTMALLVVTAYWPVINLIATAMLLNAQMGGGIVKRRFDALVVLAREAITETDKPPFGHPRNVSYPVPSAVSALIRKRVNLPSRILQLPLPTPGWLDYGYPYE